jgi:predicted RNase H-like HicB family nuclease
MTPEFAYEIVIYWSECDEAFLAEAPELPGCAADGRSRAAALGAIERVIQEWIDTARSLRREIPRPRGRLVGA